MDDAKREWRALHSQIIQIETDNKGNCLETLVITNQIEEAIMENNCKFAEDYKVIHAHIDHRTNNYTNLKGKVKDLQEVVHLQRAIIDSCHNQTAALEETVVELVESVQMLERLVCCC